MATSAFKSTTKRGGGNNNTEPKKAAKKPGGMMRRSHSVSAALSRSSSINSNSNSKNSIKLEEPEISEFLNKRDNPLFCSTTTTTTNSSPPPDLARGRSTSRYPILYDDVACDGRAGRRGRSVSRPRRRQTSQSEDEEQNCVTQSSYRSQNVNIPANRMKKGVVSDNVVDVHGATVRKQCTELSSYLEGPWEDAVSTDSWTVAEEKTIKAVYEQIKGDYVDGAVSPSNAIYETVQSEVRHAILDIQSDLENTVQRNNIRAMAAINVVDIPPDLVNPGAVELVSDIRMQYAKKLEESQERATKLRAELAVEEHRGQEFVRILKEIIPDPKLNNVQKSRPGRKRSNERKNMSKRLTEEAMAYFDECVSISTFDSSDFSAAEDHPPFSLVEPVSTRVGATCVPTTNFANSSLNHNQDAGHGVFVNRHLDSDLTASSGRNEPLKRKKLIPNSRFSFCQKPTESGGLQQDIRSYIRNIEKEYVETNMNLENSRANYYDIDRYMHVSGERVLLDMVLSKNRIECGSLHLCGGGLGILFPPFACNF